jgi:eukaryotic-like serine/threonine-protein kinase
MGTTVPPQSATDALVGRELDGRYLIAERIARGGMATVYRAVDTRLDRTVAIKVMHASLAEDPGFVERFRREAKAAAALSHPNVVAVHDQGNTDGMSYLVMEFIAGRTLRDVLSTHGPLTPAQALAILEPVLDALAAAHSAGFVHRDVKPENILISDDGRVKVADFGLARTVSTATVTQGLLIGTVAYLSPEHVELGVADARSDVYGAGICLFEMLTGTVPYAGDSPINVAYQHVNTDVPRPSSLIPGIPIDVDDLVETATRREPGQRYRDCGEFAERVRAVRRELPAPEPFARTAATQPGPAGAPGIPPGESPAAGPTLVVAHGDRPTQPTTAGSGARSTGEQPRRRRRAPAVIAALLLLGAVAGAAFGAWYLAAGPGRSVAVPGVLGLDVAAATQAAADAELTLIVAGEEYSETVAAGLIVSADPEPGAEVAPGAEIAVIVSLGPERFEVPNLTGLSESAARDAVVAAGLTVGNVRTQFDAVVPAGQVVSSDPAAGDALKADSPVSFVVSDGPKPVKIPELVGTSADQARATLEAEDLVVATTEEFSTSYSAGVVMSTVPAAGEKVDVGGTVTLVVSKGPPPVEVPYLIDMFREEAVALIESLGLVANVQEGPFTPLNRVINQDPTAGSYIPVGSTVTITII